MSAGGTNDGRRSATVTMTTQPASQSALSLACSRSFCQSQRPALCPRGCESPARARGDGYTCRVINTYSVPGAGMIGKYLPICSTSEPTIECRDGRYLSWKLRRNDWLQWPRPDGTGTVFLKDEGTGHRQPAVVVVPLPAALYAAEKGTVSGVCPPSPLSAPWLARPPIRLPGRPPPLLPSPNIFLPLSEPPALGRRILVL